MHYMRVWQDTISFVVVEPKTISYRLERKADVYWSSLIRERRSLGWQLKYKSNFSRSFLLKLYSWLDAILDKVRVLIPVSCSITL